MQRPGVGRDLEPPLHELQPTYMGNSKLMLFSSAMLLYRTADGSLAWSLLTGYTKVYPLVISNFQGQGAAVGLTLCLLLAYFRPGLPSPAMIQIPLSAVSACLLALAAWSRHCDLTSLSCPLYMGPGPSHENTWPMVTNPLKSFWSG